MDNNDSLVVVALHRTVSHSVRSKVQPDSLTLDMPSHNIERKCRQIWGMTNFYSYNHLKQKDGQHERISVPPDVPDLERFVNSDGPHSGIFLIHLTIHCQGNIVKQECTGCRCVKQTVSHVTRMRNVDHTDAVRCRPHRL